LNGAGDAYRRVRRHPGAGVGEHLAIHDTRILPTVSLRGRQQLVRPKDALDASILARQRQSRVAQPTSEDDRARKRNPWRNRKLFIRSAIVVDLAHGWAAAPEDAGPRPQERLGCSHGSVGARGDTRVVARRARPGPLGRRPSSAGVPPLLSRERLESQTGNPDL